MRDPIRHPERWRSLGRLLPSELRRRVFEPALDDLIYAWLSEPNERGRLPFAIHVLGTYVGCVPLAIPSIFVRERRLTKIGQLVLWGGTVAVGLLVAVAMMARSYAS